MLYITTRQVNDAYTAPRTCSQNLAPDGGFFVPFRIFAFTREEIMALQDKSFCQTIADVLNLFFSSRFNGLDVELWIGKNPYTITTVNQKICIAELWHNPMHEFSYIVNCLYRKLCQTEILMAKPTVWVQIAIRIAALFAVVGQMQRQNLFDFDNGFDVAVCTDNFSAVMAVWYAKKMGMPIKTIVCSCNNNGLIWDILCRGEVNTVGNKLPAELEQLVFNTLGLSETERYLAACKNERTYLMDEETHKKFCDGMFAAVVGNNRISAVINSMYRTNSYIVNPDAAIALGGLQDYRASVGESRMALLLEEDSPSLYAELIAEATGVAYTNI